MTSLAGKDLASQNEAERVAKKAAKQAAKREQYLARYFAAKKAAQAAKKAEQAAKEAEQKAEQDRWRADNYDTLIREILETASRGLQLGPEAMEEAERYGATEYSQLDWDNSQVSFDMVDRFVTQIRSIDPTVGNDEILLAISRIFNEIFEATFLDDIVRVLLDNDSQAMIKKLQNIMDESNWRELIRAEARTSLPRKFVDGLLRKMLDKSSYSAQNRFELSDSIVSALESWAGSQQIDLTHSK